MQQAASDATAVSNAASVEARAIQAGGWRAAFPAASSHVYLDHASVGPMPRVAVDAIAASLLAQAEHGSLRHPALHEQVEIARREFAAFIGARADQVANVASTSTAISLIATGLPWQAGDEVVVPAIDFPSAVLPWRVLEARGVVVRLVECIDGRVEIERLLQACTARTRVVCASWVQFSSGFRLDVERLGHACRQRGIWLVIDGAQAVGALSMRVDALPVDALVTHCYKWMVGPQGVGWMHLGDALAGKLALSAAGVRTVTPKASYFDHAFDPKPEAARFETGILNFHGIVGMRASLALLREVGTQRIEERIGMLVARLVDGLQAHGCALKGGADRSDFRSGIVAFNAPGHSAADCHTALLRANIVTSAREGYVRVSPHFYNDEADVDALLDCVKRMG